MKFWKVNAVEWSLSWPLYRLSRSRLHLARRKDQETIAKEISVIEDDEENEGGEVIVPAAGVLKPHLVMHEGAPMTTSMAVAKHFGKLHKDVLKAIKNLDCSSGFTQRNFALCFKTNDLANGKRIPYYRMTRDGFVFLVMGFTGKEAAAWKEAYIAAFNSLEQAVMNRLLETHAQAVAERDALMDVVNNLVERVEELEHEVRLLRFERDELSLIKHRITGPEELGVMMVLCDMRAPDAQLLGFLLRKVYELDEYRPAAIQASAEQLAHAIGWPSVQQVRVAIKRLEARGLVKVIREKRGCAPWFSVQAKVLEALLKAHREGAHGLNNRYVLVPDSESPVAALIRRVIGYPQGEHDAGTEALIEERNRLPVKPWVH